MTSIQFLGGAETVTGSKYLVHADGKNVLVDCGMFQGLKSLRLKNWADFPIDPGSIDALILTHAHIDHSGYIPVLIKAGFRGKIYATEATYDLCKILLPDAGYLAEEEAEFLNRHRRSKHQPALPLFTEEEAEASLSHFKVVGFEESVQISANFKFEFRYAGHILGAASAILTAGKKTIAFTGDIGRPEDPVLFGPKVLPPVDYLVTESTYGNRRHELSDPAQELKEIVEEACATNGVVLIPAFAVGRAQELMYYLWQLKKAKLIPDIPMYLNSPMATNVNALYAKHLSLHKLSEADAREFCQVVKYVRSVEESKALNRQKGPALIISASGMISGGRILHHIKEFGPEKSTIIVLSGFQAAGTRGEAIEHGASEVKIHGEYIPIRAKVRVLRNTSAHADYAEIIDWLKKSNMHPQRVFITHGEPAAADAMRVRLKDNFGWDCMIPTAGEKVELR